MSGERASLKNGVEEKERREVGGPTSNQTLKRHCRMPLQWRIPGEANGTVPPPLSDLRGWGTPELFWNPPLSIYYVLGH